MPEVASGHHADAASETAAAVEALLTPTPRDDEPVALPRFSLRTRLTLALAAAAILPLAGFGILLLAWSRLPGTEPTAETLGRLLVLAIAGGVIVAMLLAFVLAADVSRPLRAIARSVERVSAGDLSTPIEVIGDDELARLAESHNRLAADLERRNDELARIVASIASASPRETPEWLAGRAAADARDAFGLIEADVLLVDPAEIPIEDTVPGEPRTVRADLRAGNERLGVLVGRLPATRPWDRAEQDLLELFASEIAVAMRSAQLFARVEAQNAQLVELDAAKDEFLRGVSHNLQTPLARISAYAARLEAERADRRLGIIAEQADRLSRMVRQLLTVTRLESGDLRPQPEVLSLAPRVRRAWEALAASEVPFRLDDHSGGWLAVADADGLEQVLWALLDNAVKYGGGAPVSVTIAADEATSRLRLTVADGGPGIAEVDRPRLFGRFERGGHEASEAGSGLGLYVSRELCRAMGGDLVLEPGAQGSGAAFSAYLPAESPTES